MEGIPRGCKAPRRFTPEQKFAILQDINAGKSVKEGIRRHGIAVSLYYKWRRQLDVGVKASLRNSKPPADPQLKALQTENKTLKEMVLNLSHQVCELKKTLSLGQG